MAQKSVSEPVISLGAQQLTALLDSTRELIAILGLDCSVQFANTTFQNLLGYTPEFLLGREILAVVHSQDVESLRTMIDRAARQAAASLGNMRCRMRGRDGSFRWCDVSCRSLREYGVEGVVLNAIEVSELHRMESERQVISEVVHALNATSNLDQLLVRIHEALKRILSAENCFIAWHDTADDTFFCPFFADEFDASPPPQKVGRSCTTYVFR